MGYLGLVFARLGFAFLQVVDESYEGCGRTGDDECFQAVEERDMDCSFAMNGEETVRLCNLGIQSWLEKTGNCQHGIWNTFSRLDGLFYDSWRHRQGRESFRPAIRAEISCNISHVPGAHLPSQTNSEEYPQAFLRILDVFFPSNSTQGNDSSCYDSLRVAGCASDNLCHLIRR